VCMRAAVLRKHDHKEWKLVPMAQGQSEDFDPDRATRDWLWPHLGHNWHLMAFVDVPGVGPRVGDGTPDAALAISEHAFRAGWTAMRASMKAEVDADFGHREDLFQQAWDAYDPPEHIKDLT